MGGFLRDCPCRPCDKHKENCHANCEVYKEWSELYSKLKDEEAKERAVDVAISNHRTESIMRTVKKKGYKFCRGHR